MQRLIKEGSDLNEIATSFKVENLLRLRLICSNVLRLDKL